VLTRARRKIQTGERAFKSGDKKRGRDVKVQEERMVLSEGKGEKEFK